MKPPNFSALLPRFVALLALCSALSVRAHAAPAPLGPDVWSMQVDAGLFAPIEANGAGPTGGLRYCKHYGTHLQVGALTGWTYKRATWNAPPPGQPESEAQVEIARTDANLVPLMGFMQVDFMDRSRIVPFFGFGLGYEWLMVHSLDYQTGAQSKATYSNIAWQTYAGIGLQLSYIWRLNSELFYKGGSLERTVPLSSGGVQREAVHVNGVGVRVGLDMKFD